MYKKHDITNAVNAIMEVQAKLKEVGPPEEDPMAELYRDVEFVDDVTGAPLDKNLTMAARRSEIAFFRKRGVYVKVPRQKGMRVLSTRWLDVNKGDESSPEYRARLVGREIAREKREDLFAATPPLESLKLIMARCASRQMHREKGERFLIMSNDVKRAYFYAEAPRPLYIDIPEEDREPGDEGMVGCLQLSLYGTRDAAMNWAREYTSKLESWGFRKGSSSPCNFYHPAKDVSVTVHGDDFTSAGTESSLMWLKASWSRVMK